MQKIVSLADLKENDVVIEIGAGLGFLTEMIASRSKETVALEVDPFLIEILKDRLSHISNVTIVHTDVLQFNFSGCASSKAGKVKVIGNIPYHISSQILFHLLSHRESISMMVLMVQKELADRLVAEPGTKEYGIPTIMLSIYTQCSREFIVPGSCFFPAPEIMSSVLKVNVREKPKVEIHDHTFFAQVVRAAFSQRRKTLMNALRSSLSPRFDEDTLNEAFLRSGIDGKRRGETLTPDEFGVLSNTLYALENP